MRKLIIAICALGFVAVIWILASNAVVESAGADAGNPQLVALGQTLYGANCAVCHGRALEGQPNWRTPLPTGGLPAPPHDASGHTWHHSDQLLFDYTKKGGQALVPASFKSNMPAFGGMLSDRDIWAVLAYIKSTWPSEIRRRQEQLNK